MSTYEGHKVSNYSVKVRLNKDNSFFATGSEDGNVYFYTLLEKTPKFVLPAHGRSVVSCIDINRKDNSMVSCSHDGKIVLWKVPG